MSIDTIQPPVTPIPSDMYKMAYDQAPGWVRILLPTPQALAPPGTYPPWWFKYLILGFAFMFVLWGLKSLAAKLFG